MENNLRLLLPSTALRLWAGIWHLHFLELFDNVQKSADYLIIRWLRRSVIGPRQIIDLDDFHDFAILIRVVNLKLSLDKIFHQTLARDERDLNILLGLNERDGLADLGRPVSVAPNFSVLLDLGQVENQRNILLHDHAPKVLASCRQRPLRRDENLVVCLDGRVYVVGVDVAVRNIGATLLQADSRVLEWLQVGVAVEVATVGLLPGHMVLCLRQLADEAELALEVADERLPLEVREKDALLEHLDFLDLAHPLI